VLENVLGFVARDTAAVAFSGTAGSGSHDIARFAVRAVSLVAAIALLMAGIFYLSSGPLLSVLAPGWSSTSRAEAQTAFLLASTIIFFQTLVYFFIGYESINGRFIASGVRPIALGVAGVAALFVGHDLEASIAFIASQGLVFGMFALFFLVVFWRENRLWLALENRTVIGARSIAFSLGAIPISALVVALHQMPFLIERAYATTVAPGTAILLSFVYRLVTIPQSVFAASALAVMVPSLLMERRAGAGDVTLASRGFAMALLLGILSLTVFVTLNDCLPVLLGVFGMSVGSDVVPFGDVVLAYSIGIPGYFVTLYMIKAAIVYERPGLLLIPGLISVAIQFFALRYVASSSGASGVALATSFFFISFAIASYFSVSKHIPLALDGRLLWKTAVACLLTGILSAALPSPESLTGIVMKSVVFFVALAFSLRLVGDKRLISMSYWQGLFHGGRA